MNNDDRAKFEALTDEQIIAIKKSTKCSDPYKPWGDTLAFARSILASAQAASAEPVARMPPLLNANDLSTNFCAKWSGAQKVEAGDILDWIMQQPLYTTPAPAVAPAAVTEALPGELLALACWLDAQVLHWQAVRGLPDDDEEVRALRKWARMIRAASPTPDEQRAQAAQEDVEAIVDRVCNDVAELPDRNSPEDWPEAMLVTHDELAEIVRTALAGRQQL